VTWQTNLAVITLRNIARKAGLNRVIGRLRPNRGYEFSFDVAIFSHLREGDVVWDVGANVGYYTKRFADMIGPLGMVFAFEPLPGTIARLRENLEGVKNYALVPFALGAESGFVTMQTGGDALGATNRIVDNAHNGDMTIQVETGDAVIASGQAKTPTLIKIDTEGFELDVLRGMEALIEDTPTLRALFIEVHFGLLAERGMPKAPITIEQLLKKNGFKTTWVDPSHIAAVRD
jgi:FkbM family methyltransferase